MVPLSEVDEDSASELLEPLSVDEADSVVEGLDAELPLEGEGLTDSLPEAEALSAEVELLGAGAELSSVDEAEGLAELS